MNLFLKTGRWFLKLEDGFKNWKMENGIYNEFIFENLENGFQNFKFIKFFYK